MSTNLPTKRPAASVHYSRNVDSIRARWADHVERVVVDLGDEVSIHADPATAVRLARQLIEAISETDVLDMDDAAYGRILDDFSETQLALAAQVREHGEIVNDDPLAEGRQS